MSFECGDFVLVKTIKKNGVIERVLKRGKYRVRVGNVSLTCKEEDLKSADAPQSKPPSHAHRGAKTLASHKVTEVDLHRFRVGEVPEAVTEAVNQAILKGENRLHIVHGHGTGRVKAATEKILSELDVVKRFEISRTNSGMTVVYL